MEKPALALEHKFETPEEEIAHLREQIARHEIEKIGAAIPAEEVVRSYAKAPVGSVIPEKRALTPTEVGEIVLELKPETHDDKMAELLAILRERGVKNALLVAQKLGPHIEDDFHRFLVEYLRVGYDA